MEESNGIPIPISDNEEISCRSTKSQSEKNDSDERGENCLNLNSEAHDELGASCSKKDVDLSVREVANQRCDSAVVKIEEREASGKLVLHQLRVARKKKQLNLQVEIQMVH